MKRVLNVHCSCCCAALLALIGCDAEPAMHAGLSADSGAGPGIMVPDAGGAGGNSGSGGTSGMGGTGGAGPEPQLDAGPDASDVTLDASADTGVDSGVMDPGVEGDGELSIGPSYVKDEALNDHGAPKGQEFQFAMQSEDSALFRGDDATLNNPTSFSRQINVYVPAQYVDGTAAPILIIHDGRGPLGLVRNALDNLTIETDEARRLPAFIAIAVANGGGDSKGSERGLEYDTMSERFARFIDEEVLPAVLANLEIAQAFPGLAFTDNPQGRATMGCSSGGAAALTMGWFRPDLFGRIITYSGTFVDQQDDDAAEEAAFPLGAWEYHSSMELIASSAKKPLRIFLHASEHDNGWDAPEAGHHNWVLANQRTAAALDAKGYHYRFVSALDAGHCDGKVFDATLADTLLWSWRGYPTN